MQNKTKKKHHLPQEKKKNQLPQMLRKIIQKLHYFNHYFNFSAVNAEKKPGYIQSSIEFVLESRNHNQKNLIKITAYEPTAT